MLSGNGQRSRVDKIKTDLCVFVLGFVWTPETQTMTSSPPTSWATLELRLILNFYLIIIIIIIIKKISFFKYSPLVN